MCLFQIAVFLHLLAVEELDNSCSFKLEIIWAENE